MTTHEILVAAKGYLLTHGWTQGSLCSAEGSVCVRGALFSAQGWTDFMVPGGAPVEISHLQHAAEEAICEAIGRPHNVIAVPGWNDKENRTLGEVIAALDKAIIATAPEAKPDDALTFEQTIDAPSPLAYVPAEAIGA